MNYDDRIDANRYFEILGAPQVILSGDHQQLPPVIVSEEINTKSFMERLITNVPTATLTMQFRSNEAISAWSSRNFYHSELKPHESVRSITLKDLINVKGMYIHLAAGILLLLVF